MMKQKDVLKIILILLLLVIIIQGALFYYFHARIENLSGYVNSTEMKITDRINANNLETQAKINSLTDAIGSVSSAQVDLRKQISEIKAEISADFSGIIEEEIRGVVTIRTDVSQGTGFLITSDGYVVTNAHVLSGARFANVYTFNGGVYAAGLVGFSPSGEMDLALLKINGDFSKLDLGNSDDVKIGEKVIAIGNPLGLSFTVTEGIISARDREGINEKPYYFQTDVALNPGNSGGPLINTKGKVIGINNFKISGAENVGFALEINYAIDTINDISLRVLNQTIV